MTAYQVRVVQGSFRQVAENLDTATLVFYDSLFEMAPHLERMFRSTREEQAQKMAQILCAVVKTLDHPEQILPAVRQLGRRHAGYGVKPDQYGLMGETLLWTLERCLGAAFTPDVRDGWAAAYDMLASTMQEAAEQVAMETAAAA